MPGQMFLRTALTEGRIEKLEEDMARVLRHLKLDELAQAKAEDDKEWEAAAPPANPVAKPLRAQRERGPMRAKG